VLNHGGRKSRKPASPEGAVIAGIPPAIRRSLQTAAPRNPRYARHSPERFRALRVPIWVRLGQAWTPVTSGERVSGGLVATGQRATHRRMSTIPLPTHRLLTPRETALLLGLSRRSVYRRIATGELEAMKLGDSRSAPVRLSPRRVEQFLERSCTARDRMQTPDRGPE
jgi:excisionase family DNA binding protein